MKLLVDQITCEGHGKCERIAPDLFQLDESGIAQVLHSGDLNPEQLPRAKAAVVLCPVKAIRLVETPAAEKSNE